MMPIQSYWYDDTQRIMVQVFEGAWKWEEVAVASNDAHTMAATAAGNVVMICDMSKTTSLPKGNVLTPARSNMSQVPENITLIIFVIQSRLVEVFANLLVDMLPGWRKRAHIVRTVAEAEKLALETIAKNAPAS
jgi:hypothetical protein